MLVCQYVAEFSHGFTDSPHDPIQLNIPHPPTLQRMQKTFTRMQVNQEASSYDEILDGLRLFPWSEGCHKVTL